jgi:sialic acid synthase SpsE
VIKCAIWNKLWAIAIKSPTNWSLSRAFLKRRGVYAAKDLRPGEVLTRELVHFWAPSQPDSTLELWPGMMGSKLAKPVKAHDPITAGDLKSV